MPGIDGFEIAEKLTEGSRKAIIIFVTSHDDDVYHVWEYRPIWFLRKNHLEDLPNALAQMYSEPDTVKKNSDTACLKQKTVYWKSCYWKPIKLKIQIRRASGHPQIQICVYNCFGFEEIKY